MIDDDLAPVCNHKYKRREELPIWNVGHRVGNYWMLSA